MNCYVADPKGNYSIPPGCNKENTLFWPEQSMTTKQKHTSSRPRDFHILTDAPELVGLYDYKDVFVWKDGEWENPEFQTFGTSLEIIIYRIWGIKNSIPAAIISRELVTNCMGRKISEAGDSKM